MDTLRRLRLAFAPSWLRAVNEGLLFNCEAVHCARMQKYETLLGEINVEIKRFNALLADDVNLRIPLLTTSGESWYVTADVPFAKIAHPFNTLPGVYILCACRQSDPLSVGAYIGKSSGARTAMGARLDSWFRADKATKLYRMDDPGGEAYIIEAISAIGLRDPRMRTFASALEEFIIAGVRDRVHLLNRSGNPKR